MKEAKLPREDGRRRERAWILYVRRRPDGRATSGSRADGWKTKQETNGCGNPVQMVSFSLIHFDMILELC